MVSILPPGETLRGEHSMMSIGEETTKLSGRIASSGQVVYGKGYTA